MAWQLLPGAASNRMYYRFKSSDRAIVCVDSTAEPKTMRAWIDMQSLLKKHGIAVPEIYQEDNDNHCYWICDLGSKHYLDNISKVDPNDIIALLRQLASLPMPQSLDNDYVDKCVTTFKRHIVNVLPESEIQQFNKLDFSWLDQAFTQSTPGFCHTDFHSGNIMLFENKLTLIDFQDACCRPLAYDWASWLYDFYHDFEESTRQDILNKYTPVGYADNKQWQNDIYLSGLLRSLRVWGRFVELSHTPGKTHYKKYIKTVKARVVYFSEKHPNAAQFNQWVKGLV